MTVFGRLDRPVPPFARGPGDRPDGAPAGIYYLTVDVNDDDVFVESNTSNNLAWKSFRLTRESNGNPKVTLISNSPCNSPNMCGEALPNR